MRVIVYTKPSCGQCIATCKALTAAGIDYDTVDLTADRAALAHIQALGYRQAPVVITQFGDHWAGFRPDRCKNLAS